VLPPELLNKMIDEAVVKIFTSEMGVSCRGLHFEDALLDGEKGDIESSSAEIEDEYVPLAGDLLIKAVCDGCCSGFIDDTKNVETRNRPGIFGDFTFKSLK
jgi:NAD-specific glutamate dehydrogenase